MDVAYIIIATGSLVSSILISCSCIHTFKSKLCTIETTSVMPRTSTLEDRAQPPTQAQPRTATPVAYLV